MEEEKRELERKKEKKPRTLSSLPSPSIAGLLAHGQPKLEEGRNFKVQVLILLGTAILILDCHFIL